MPTCSAEDFWASFYAKSAGTGIPFEATWELTHRCNLNCVHCYVPEKNRRVSLREEMDLSSGEIFHVLDQMAELGCFQLNLTGGEPLMRPDFFEILAYAKKKGFYVLLQTNGTLLTASLVNQLVEGGADQVEVSLYGVTSSVHEDITRVKGSFERCVQGIERLRRKNIGLSINMMVLTLNRHQIRHVKAFAQKRGARFQADFLIHPRIDGSKEPLKYRLSPRKAIELELKSDLSPVEEGLDLVEESEKESGQACLFNCSAGRNSLAITPDGKLNLCLECRIPGYDVRKGTLAEGWGKLSEYVNSMRPSASFECTHCELGPYCDWCPSAGLLEKGDLSACVDYHRQLASIRKKREKN